MPHTAPLRQRLLDEIERKEGQTDRELANHLLGREAPQQSVNQAARALERERLVSRRTRADGLIGNYSAPALSAVPAAASRSPVFPGRVRLAPETTQVAVSNAWLTETT